jgi:hypothetical protein
MSMSPKERDRLLRRLTGDYLIRPRPDDWIVAADALEEGCDGGLSCLCKRGRPCLERAAVWRHRAFLYPPLAEGFKDSAGRPGAGLTVYVVPVWFSFLCRPTYVSVRVLAPYLGGGYKGVATKHWNRYESRPEWMRRRYLSERIHQLIAECSVIPECHELFARGQ